MDSKIKTVLVLTGLFCIIAIFWVLVGNLFIDVKPINTKQDIGDATFNKATINLIVENVNNSINYYKEVFGFDVIVTYPETGLPDFAIIKRNDVEIMFQTMASMPEDIRLMWKDTISGSFTLYFDIENVEEYYNSVKEKCEIVHDLKETFYGTREFTVKDNSGYLLTFAQNIQN